MAPGNKSELLAQIKSLQTSKKYADLTIRCGKNIFRVHRAIVCTRSKVLARAIDGKFKEATTNDIDLSANKFETVQAMIQYIYSEEYSDKAASASRKSLPKKDGLQMAEVADTNGAAVDGPIPFNARIYIIADAYEVVGLKQYSQKKFKAASTASWNKESFMEAVHLLWEGTVESDRLIRDCVAKIAKQHLEELLQYDTFVDFMRREGDFGLGILKETVREEQHKDGERQKKKSRKSY